jgi:hypothetical protein
MHAIAALNKPTTHARFNWLARITRFLPFLEFD